MGRDTCRDCDEILERLGHSVTKHIQAQNRHALAILRNDEAETVEGLAGNLQAALHEREACVAEYVAHKMAAHDEQYAIADRDSET